MVPVIQRNNDICRLDYLVGTLATAYKGPISSLVAKDFCMSSSGIITTLKGTVLSMPAGEYEASLIQSGAELSRANLVNGYFEFTADSGRIAEARDLQIDIIQSGRHIGTFLLKKENAGGLYVSAVELSEALAGLDLTRLTIPLREKVGLLQRAEEIVSQIHSTKKDWVAFSNKLNGFAMDFYWSEPEAFYRAFDILVHFTLLAAERAAPGDTGKPVSNFFDLLEALLEKEHERTRLRALAETWISALSRSSLDLSQHARRAVAAIQEIHKKFPDINTSGALTRLVGSLRATSASMTVLDSRLLAVLGKIISPETELLSRFGEPGKRRMEGHLIEAERRLGAGEDGQALEIVAGCDLDILDDRNAVSALFDFAENKLATAPAETLAEAIVGNLSFPRPLSGAALTLVRRETPRLIDRLIALNRPDACSVLLRRIGDSRSPVSDQILLDPRVARSVLHSGERVLRERYGDDLKRILIPAARVQGISPDTWAEIVNPLHLERLNSFMDLLTEGNVELEGVLVHVIANVAVSGVLIPDDQLFQRRISAYLNSDAMKGRFLLNYLLLERFPVYFNEVGATSRIRDYSTEIDSWGDDPVVYFLRKQVHVNASSHNVRLLESVIRSWVRNEPLLLKQVVPPDIYQQANPRLIKRYSSIMIPFFSSMDVQDAAGLHLDRLLALPDETIDKSLQVTENEDNEAKVKVRLLCKLYKEIVRKYALLNRDSAVGEVHARLQDKIKALQELKHIVLSPEKTEPQESLYFKRHIAFGIPSVLGTYNEPKFDALKNLMLHGEEFPVLLQTILSDMEKKGPTFEHTDLLPWASLSASWEILKLYGMQNVQVDEYVEVLEHNPLHPTQRVDVLKLCQKELAWMVASLSRTFHGPLVEIIGKFPQEDLPEQLMNLDTASPDFVNKAADVVMRDILNSIPGLVEFDRLLETLVRILLTTGSLDVEGGREPVGGPWEPEVYDLQTMTLREARMLGPELGNKAKNLVYLKDKGFRIPMGAVLPARLTMNFDRPENQNDFMTVLQKAVRILETKTNATFGKSRRPLFLSVRSGSYLSMPGILSSILYCGMNVHTVEGFIDETGDPNLGWDSYRRFIEHYATAVFGLKMEFFERIAKDYWGAHPGNVEKPQEARHLSAIVGLYKSRLRAIDLLVPEDVYVQLQHCIRAVYASWNSTLARQYRAATGSSEYWGTAVMLMEMVSGNQEGGGSSVFFTRDPTTLDRVIYGETVENGSGDDLVSGRKSGRPLSRTRATTDRQSLEDRDPELYRLHQDLARRIEDAFDGLPQEVEVTYTREADGRPILSVLQTRRMEQGGTFFNSFDEICEMESRVIGRGIGAHGGALSGVASFATSIDPLERLRTKSGMPVILLRKTANTDDVSLMPIIKGILSASGGVTSHAAVLAQKFGLTAVVACADMNVSVDEQGRPYAMIGNTRVEEGNPISIDGANGLVFSGTCFQQGLSSEEPGEEWAP